MISQQDDYQKRLLITKLEKHLPKPALTIICNWIIKFRVQFIVSPARKTKIGDFRPGKDINSHTITINGDLNPYAFLVTTIHEFAHLLVWNKYGRKVKPHGNEWQNAFGFLLKGFLERNVFPPDLEIVIKDYAKKPEAASCSNPALTKALQRYDKESHFYLDDLPFGAKFIIDDKVFLKGDKLRRRFKCKLLPSERLYLVHESAKIRPFDLTN